MRRRRRLGTISVSLGCGFVADAVSRAHAPGDSRSQRAAILTVAALAQQSATHGIHQHSQKHSAKKEERFCRGLVEVWFAERGRVSANDGPMAFWDARRGVSSQKNRPGYGRGSRGCATEKVDLAFASCLSRAASTPRLHPPLPRDGAPPAATDVGGESRTGGQV